MTAKFRLTQYPGFSDEAIGILKHAAPAGPTWAKLIEDVTVDGRIIGTQCQEIKRELKPHNGCGYITVLLRGPGTYEVSTGGRINYYELIEIGASYAANRVWHLTQIRDESFLEAAHG